MVTNHDDLIVDNPVDAYDLEQEAIRQLLRQIEDGLGRHDRRARSLRGHHWGHVGDLVTISEILTDVKDRLCLTGEYAANQ